MDVRRMRKFPGNDRGTLRPDRKAQRRLDAVTRQAEFDKLTPEEKAVRTGD